MCIVWWGYKVRVWAQACDSHPYSTYCFFLEEMNKRGIAYIHMVEPRAKGKEGAASPIAEFGNEHRDETLDVRPRVAACSPVTHAAVTHMVAYACQCTRSHSASCCLTKGSLPADITRDKDGSCEAFLLQALMHGACCRGPTLLVHGTMRTLHALTLCNRAKHGMLGKWTSDAASNPVFRLAGFSQGMAGRVHRGRVRSRPLARKPGQCDMLALKCAF